MTVTSISSGSRFGRECLAYSWLIWFKLLASLRIKFVAVSCRATLDEENVDSAPNEVD